jgi:hypothetical protein
MRDGSQPFDEVSKRKYDLISIVVYAEKLGLNEETHALHKHYPVLTRHQQDVSVSYLCQDRSKLWKYKTHYVNLMKIRQVF